MSASMPRDPRLGKSQALNIAQGTTTRLSSLIPNVATQLSPVTVYTPGAPGGAGNELLAAPGHPVTVSSSYGVWVAPDVNGDGSTWYATVECFGGGGGGGAGNSTQGGGGGGGAEYAREDQYPIEPGKSYVYVVGLPGSGGFSNTAGNPGQGTAGTTGGTTVFDLAGLGLAGGVVANGGQGGDQTSIGIGGTGGNGSNNTIHYNGGNGGTNVSGNGSDNPISLSQISGMFVGNTLNPSIITTWYIMNDSALANSRNDATGNNHGANWLNITAPGFTTGGTNPPQAPAQVPAYTSPAGTWGPNQTTAGWVSEFNVKSTSQASARVNANVPGFDGSRLTVSCWIQAPAAATWGNTANGSIAVIASNSQHPHTNSLQGYALYLLQEGTPSAPAWNLQANVGNGFSLTQASGGTIAATPGTWYYIVMTYNAGTLKIYVNGALIQSAVSSGYTSVPGGPYNSRLGLDPAATANWFFGNISNIWWATDCATATMITQAYGLTPATGGAGGGASGGPSAQGGNGISASGATAGAGGTPPTQPTSVASNTTAARGGYAGSNFHTSNPSPSAPSGGSYGGGGGGCGSSAAPPALTTLTYPFTAAATYAGTDATSNPSNPYNTNQQANPTSGLNTLLYAGGLASDAASGSKNSVLLLPKGLSQTISTSGHTITAVLLTLTNAYPNNPVESILEVGYSNDTTLPQTYTGSSIAGHVGAVEIPPGAGTITYDLTQTGLATHLANGTATALVIGPGASPTINAYNAPTGPQFYSSIYGPGAYDTSGNPQYPYLTILYEPTSGAQQGSNAAGGGILVTNVDNKHAPVAFIQPYAGTDVNGNNYAAGLTAPVTVQNGNTPVAWIQPVAGTDVHGNNYAPGYTGAVTTQSGNTPIAVVQPVPGVDAQGNTYAAGVTGPITAYDPTVTTPGSLLPEVWKSMSLINSWKNQGGGDLSCQYRMLPTGSIEICGTLNTNGGTVTSRTFFTLPSAYWPVTTFHGFWAFCTDTNSLNYYGICDNSGNLSINGDPVTGSHEIVFAGIISTT